MDIFLLSLQRWNLHGEVSGFDTFPTSMMLKWEWPQKASLVIYRNGHICFVHQLQ